MSFRTNPLENNPARKERTMKKIAVDQLCVEVTRRSDCSPHFVKQSGRFLRITASLGLSGNQVHPPHGCNVPFVPGLRLL